jgi:tRNA threonylcarbamoyl adenosine modification protein (Sua5/YciO/YrdC/YwlC family)
VSQYFVIHPETPQPRLIRQAAEIIRGGGVVVYPTDATYALGCLIGDKDALDRIRRIRGLDESHQLTLVCRDLSEIASYAKVGNAHYRLLKAMTPGPFTFILPATKQVPRRVQHPKRKTIGIRVPDNAILQALLTELGEPLMSTTLQLPGDEQPLNDPYEVRQRLEKLVDLIIDGAFGDLEPTTVVDLSEDVPRVVREGRGDVTRLGAL